MTRYLGPRGRYGVPILATPDGRWFWSGTLSDVNFVRTGKVLSDHQVALRITENTLAGAVRVAARCEAGQST